MKKVTLLAAILASTLSTGCSTVMSQKEYNVNIQSAPEAAKFEVFNQAGIKVHSGQTPQNVLLKSGVGYFDGESYTIKFSKDGYVNHTAHLETGIDGWYWGNLIFGGILGLLIIDPLTGAMYNLPPAYSVSLDQNPTANNLTITSYASLTDEQKARLVRIN